MKQNIESKGYQNNNMKNPSNLRVKNHREKISCEEELEIAVYNKNCLLT